MPYVGARYSGAAARGHLSQGGNCQLWAYELLACFILFNPSDDAWGAHVGVWVGRNRVAHLSKDVGYPVVWGLEEFSALERYRVVVGVKRPTVHVS